MPNFFLINKNGRIILFANPAKYKIIQKKLNKKIFCDNESKIEKFLTRINVVKIKKYLGLFS